MKYILDFDRTLFDVEQLYTALEALRIRHLAGTLASLDQVSMDQFLFADTRDFLQAKNREDVFILSSIAGQTLAEAGEYQKQKIATAGVTQLAAAVIITAAEKGPELEKLAQQFSSTEPIVFVDDKIEHCLSVRATCPQVHCFLIVRNPALIGAVDTVQGISVVHTLQAVDDNIATL